MKLIDILRITDSLSKIVVWEAKSNDNDEPLFEGFINEVPWSIAEMELYKGLEGNEFELSVRMSDSDAKLVACVTDER